MANCEGAALQYCQVNPVKPENIPKLLKSLDRWVVWKRLNEKPDGRFDKIPICPVSQRKISFTERRNICLLKLHSGLIRLALEMVLASF